MSAPAAGVVLSFLGSPSNPHAMTEIAELVQASAGLGEDHVAVACIFTGQPDDIASLAAISSNGLSAARSARRRCRAPSC
jgi:hypothetical protein